jgi:hypothetical protein
MAVMLPAQTIHSVPQSFASADAPALTSAPGIGTARRLQVIVATSELVPLAGRELTGLALRRDISWTEALPAATGSIVVRVGQAAHEPDQAVRSFAGNLPSPTEVFRGTLQAPALPASPSTPSWTAGDTLHVAFTPPILYQGGPLCVEFEPLNSPGIWWPIDAVTDPTAGSVTSVGAACGPSSHMIETAGAQQASLVIGRTAIFDLIGAPSAPAWLLVGLGLRPAPIELSAFGAPGCQLRVDAFTAVPTVLSDAATGLAGHGLANVELQIPSQTGLAGAPLGLQFLELTPAAFVASNALSCQIATTPPSLPMTTVVSRAGEQPDVIAVGVPVLGLEWR